MNEKQLPLAVICGPTACGKTALAIEAARKFGGEIVNADSMQIYKYMDIGTAKPTPEERAAAVHHLVDIIDPRSGFSVAEYVPMAHRAIFDIYSQKKLPILAGGTGLYITSTVNDVTFGSGGSDERIRNELNIILKEKGAEYLLDMLSRFDPESAAQLHPNNSRRIIRAIEFYKTTGKTISEHRRETKLIKSRYMPLMIMPDFDRAALYERINKRVDIMFAEGLENEVRRLLDMGCTPDMQSMQGIGYKETVRYINGEISFDECSGLIKMNSRRYAKRQLTWFARDERIIKIRSGGDALKIISEFLKKIS